MAKDRGGAKYVFAAAMSDKTAQPTLALKGLTGETTIEVIGEGRTLKAVDGRFVDRFEGYDFHLYKTRYAGRPRPLPHHEPAAAGSR